MDVRASSHRPVRIFTERVALSRILLVSSALAILYYHLFTALKSPDEAQTEMLVQTEPIIKVHDLKTYVVGSYVEHRLGARAVRTIAIVHRGQRAEYRCFLCCNGTNVTVPGTCSVHTDHFNFDYGTADILCPVPETCGTPTHAAITSGSHDARVLQPVENQQVREDFPYQFTVCISAMFDYVDVLRLVQALEMFRILGVGRVVIYRTSCSRDVRAVLDHYVRRGLVEIVPWTISSYINVSRGWRRNLSPGELHYFGQIAALNDCVYRYMYRSRYVALQDLDELILPMRLQKWTQLLPELERRHGKRASFVFQNNIFPLFIKNSKPECWPESWRKVVGENILDHIQKLNNKKEKHLNSKVIANPRLVIAASVHGLLQALGGSSWVDPGTARMYHFKNLSSKAIPTGSLMRDAHIRDYADALVPAVTEVLQQALDVR